MQRNLVAVFDALVRSMPHAESSVSDQLCWTLTHVDFAVFNSIFAAKLAAATAGRAIEAAKERARRNGVPVLWWIAPGDTPADLAQRLTDSGFSYAATLPGMSLDLRGIAASAPPDTDDVRIETVSNERDAHTWCDVFAEGFGFPQSIGDDFLPIAVASARDAGAAYRSFLLSSRGEPVATAASMLTGDVAGIYNVATLPNARRRGFGAMLTSHAATDARNRGASVAVLQSSAAGFGVYRALGFRECGSFEQFVFTP